MRAVLVEGEVVFEGTYEECVEYAKDFGIMRWVSEYGCWTICGDAAII